MVIPQVCLTEGIESRARGTGQKGEKRQNEACYGNQGREAREGISCAIIPALRKLKRLTGEKPREEECGELGRNPRSELKTSMTLGLGV